MELRSDEDDLLHDGVAELDRAGALIDDLLFLARHDAVPSRRIDLDVDEVVRNAVATARTRHPDVVFTVETTPVRFVGDPAAMTRLVTNLVENAAHYGSGRVLASVEGEAVGDGDCDRGAETGPGARPAATITIDDDGPGIPASERDQIFERSSRLDESRSRRTGGTGLGLAIAAEIVASHDGSISVGESELGGARFAVWLPTGAPAGPV